MYRLPPKHTQAGQQIRETLKNLGVLRQATGKEHFAGCLVIPVIDERGMVQEVYDRRISPDNKSIKISGMCIYRGSIEAYLIYLSSMPARKLSSVNR
ncbi:hypothetical protein GCM10027340_09770 [Marinomonas epiphytica]